MSEGTPKYEAGGPVAGAKGGAGPCRHVPPSEPRFYEPCPKCGYCSPDISSHTSGAGVGTLAYSMIKMAETDEGIALEQAIEMAKVQDKELATARLRLAEQAAEIERQSTALARIAYGPLGYPADAMRAQDALNPERDRAGRAEKAFAIVLEAAFNQPGQQGDSHAEDAEAAAGVIHQIRQIAHDRGERIDKLEAALRRIEKWDIEADRTLYEWSLGAMIERDQYRMIAREALAADTPPPPDDADDSWGGANAPGEGAGA